MRTTIKAVPNRLGSHKKAPRARGTLLLLSGVFALFLLVLAGAIWLSTPPPAGPETIGGPFVLVDGDNHPVSDRDFRGKYMILYFGYTSCPDVCPTVLQDLTEALERLGSVARNVQPIFITVDPARDTPSLIKGYTAAFSQHLIGLTGSREAIDAVAKEYRVSTARQPSETKDAKDYSVDHSSVLYLMAPDGHFTAALSPEQKGPALAADIAKYLPSSGDTP